MKTIALVVGLVLVSGLVESQANADGSPYAPGLVYGASGVRAPGGSVRYVTLSTRRSTVVAAIGVRSGRVVRSTELRGFYGVPLVAFDNSTGGLSGDRKTLVLASYGPYPGTSGSTSFAVLATRTLKLERRIRLSGSWAFDAISPDASRVYLIQYLAVGRDPHYRVRLYDATTGKLDAEAVVDRRESEVDMRGQPVTRKSSTDGRWAYTLYARAGKAPFVHALDTVGAKAYCIDLPLKLGQVEQMSLRLKVERDGLSVRNGSRTLALVDTRRLEARKASR